MKQPALGMLVRRSRRDADLTQRALASSVGISRGYLVEIERGRRQPSDELMARMRDALGLSRSGGLNATEVALSRLGSSHAAIGRRLGVTRAYVGLLLRRVHHPSARLLARIAALASLEATEVLAILREHYHEEFDSGAVALALDGRLSASSLTDMQLEEYIAALRAERNTTETP